MATQAVRVAPGRSPIWVAASKPICAYARPNIHSAIASPTPIRSQPITLRGLVRATRAPTDAYVATGMAASATMPTSEAPFGELVTTRTRARSHRAAVAAHRPCAVRRAVPTLMRRIVTVALSGSKGVPTHPTRHEPPRTSGAGIPHILWCRPGRCRPRRALRWVPAKEANGSEEDPGWNGHLGLGRPGGSGGSAPGVGRRRGAPGAPGSLERVRTGCGGPEEVGGSQRLPGRHGSAVPGPPRPELGGGRRPGQAAGGRRRERAGRHDRAGQPRDARLVVARPRQRPEHRAQTRALLGHDRRHAGCAVNLGRPASGGVVALAKE